MIRHFALVGLICAGSAAIAQDTDTNTCVTSRAMGSVSAAFTRKGPDLGSDCPGFLQVGGTLYAVCSSLNGDLCDSQFTQLTPSLESCPPSYAATRRLTATDCQASRTLVEFVENAACAWNIFPEDGTLKVLCDAALPVFSMPLAEVIDTCTGGIEVTMVGTALEVRCVEYRD